MVTPRRNEGQGRLAESSKPEAVGGPSDIVTAGDATPPAGQSAPSVDGQAISGSPVTNPPSAAAPAGRSTPPPTYASVFPGPKELLPDGFVQVIRLLEMKMGMPVWFVVQREREDEWAEISAEVLAGLQRGLFQTPTNVPMALLLDSPGGIPHVAYKLARLFQRRASRLVIIVPQYARSAATLIALAGEELMIGKDAELGPLDVQIYDSDQEKRTSALDAVQALERVNAFAMSVMDQTMQLLLRRTRKRFDALAPLVMNYAASVVRPLLERIDAVEYTRKSRELKVAEEYAIRLMRKNYPADIPRKIAASLVADYPAHGFVIDAEEATSLGLKVVKLPADIERILEASCAMLELTAIGRLEVVQ